MVFFADSDDPEPTVRMVTAYARKHVSHGAAKLMRTILGFDSNKKNVQDYVTSLMKHIVFSFKMHGW